MTLYPNNEGNFTFYVKGKTVSEKSSIKRFDFNVICGPLSQTVILRNGGGPKIVQALKNEGFQTIISPDMMEDIFILSNQNECPITSY